MDIPGLIALSYAAVFLFFSSVSFVYVVMSLIQRRRSGGWPKMMEISQSMWQKIMDYEARLRAMIERRLRRRLPEGAELLDVRVEIREHNEHLMKETVEIEIDVTRMLGLERQCLWFEGVEYHCGNMLANETICDEESKEFNEEACQKRFMECRDYEIKRFREEECGLPFEFSYDRSPISMAKLESYEDEDSYRLCCGAKLVYKHIQYPLRSAIKEIVESDNEARYLADMIVAEVLKVIRALRALAD